MDQLKKVLEYRFWILLGAACLAPIVGWYLGHSAMVSAYDTRKKELDTKFNAIPKGENPNASWKEQADKVNSEQTAAVVATWDQMYQKQQEFKIWPEGLPAALGNPPDWEAVKNNISMLGYYPPKYKQERLKVWRIVRPIEEDTGIKTGVVRFDLDLVPDVVWPKTAPTPQMIRDAQEDLWLTAAILDAIDRVNEGYNTQIDAPIKIVQEFVLRGGSTPGAAAQTSNEATQGVAAASPNMLGSGRESRSMGDDGRTGSSTGEAGFNPDDEFGPEVEDTESGGAPASTNVASSTNMQVAGATGPASSAESRPNMGSVEKKMGRYIKKTESYRTRGFYLSLVMDHNAVPRLMVELSNPQRIKGKTEPALAWPIRIARLQQVDKSQEELVKVGGDSRSSDGMQQGAPGMTNRNRGSSKPSFTMGSQQRSSMMPASSARSTTSAGTPMADNDASGSPTSTSQSADDLNDPKLAYVCLSGEITIYLPPPAKTAPPAGPAPAPASPAPAAEPVAATPPAAAPTASTPPASTPPATTSPDAASPEAPQPAAGELKAGEKPAEGTPAPKPAEGSPPAAPSTPAAGDAKPAEAKPEEKPTDATPANGTPPVPAPKGN